MKLNLILRLFVISITLLSLTSGNIEASEKPKEVAIADQGPFATPIEELESEALEKSPAINAVKVRYAASKELIIPASALPDPLLEFTLEENVSSLSSPDFIKGEMILKLKCQIMNSEK